jgi:hypothetical protein
MFRRELHRPLEPVLAALDGAALARFEVALGGATRSSARDATENAKTPASSAGSRRRSQVVDQSRGRRVA